MTASTHATACASDKTRNLFPIPHSQILTNGNLKQNPGYDE